MPSEVSGQGKAKGKAMIDGEFRAAVCKGCWTLGSACGRCSRCIETAPQAAETIRNLLSRVQPTREEWQTLWSVHIEQERKAANERRYADAKRHEDRAAEIARHVAPADAWERAWSKQS